MLERVWRRRNPSTLLVRMQIGTAIIENSMEILQVTKNRVTMWFYNPTPGHISGKISNLKWYMHPNVHSSIIYNNQDMEATYPSINILKYKQDALCMHTHTHTHTQWNTTQS